MQLKYPSGLAIAHITCMAPDIGTDQFIMSGLLVIGSGIITTNGGTTATIEFITSAGGSIKTVRLVQRS
jgi:hypothetical protein